jgi:hypothetical protein
MKISTLLAFTCSVSAALIGATWMPGQAQTAQDLGGSYQRNESSGISGSSDGFNPYDLIHMMRLGNRDPQQFQQSTNSSLDNAAASYRNQLQEYWRQQRQRETSAADDGLETMFITPSNSF